MILKILLSLFILIVIPTILGLFFIKEKNNIFLAFVAGYLLEFATFELIYIPIYFARLPFQTLVYAWSATIAILAILSLIVNRKKGKKIVKSMLKIIKTTPKMLTIIFCIFLILQVLVPVIYRQNVDPDDAFYLATITTTLETDSLFQYNAYDGSEYTQMPLRYSLSGLCIYFATLSQILDIHPAILTHSVWPVIVIPLEYMIYGLLGAKIFKKDKEKVLYFLIFLSMLHIFGFISIYVNFSFFAYRSWQGKALIGNLIIPMVWLCYLYSTQENRFMDWLLLFCTMIAACFVTEMGVFLTPFILGILAILEFAQNRKFTNFLKFGVCCLPQCIIGILYIVLS